MISVKNTAGEDRSDIARFRRAKNKQKTASLIIIAPTHRFLFCLTIRPSVYPLRVVWHLTMPVIHRIGTSDAQGEKSEAKKGANRVHTTRGQARTKKTTPSKHKICSETQQARALRRHGTAKSTPPPRHRRKRKKSR